MYGTNWIWARATEYNHVDSNHRAPAHFPPPLHLNDWITPLLPTEIGERFSQTISNLVHAALLRWCELPQ